jgi:hypothetical protein
MRGEKASGVPDPAGEADRPGSDVISDVVSVGWSVVKAGVMSARAPPVTGRTLPGGKNVPEVTGDFCRAAEGRTQSD